MMSHCRLDASQPQRKWPPGPDDPVFESGVPTKPPIPPDHPHRDALLYDADLFWQWHPAFWSARDRAAREPVSGREVYDLLVEVAELRRELREVAQRVEGRSNGR